MSKLKSQINILQNLVNEYKEEPNELQCFIIIIKYMGLLKSIPESKSFLEKINADIAKYTDVLKPTFDSIDNIPILETTKTGIKDNSWFYYSFLDMLAESINPYQPLGGKFSPVGSSNVNFILPLPMVITSVPSGAQ